jgi:hypothetical protein
MYDSVVFSRFNSLSPLLPILEHWRVKELTIIHASFEPIPKFYFGGIINGFAFSLLYCNRKRSTIFEMTFSPLIK